MIGSDEYPVFGKLLSIYVVNHKPLFHVEVLETVEYCSHFHCYIVQLSSREVYVPGSDLLSYVPLHMHTLPGRCRACNCTKTSLTNCRLVAIFSCAVTAVNIIYTT